MKRFLRMPRPFAGLGSSIAAARSGRPVLFLAALAAFVAIAPGTAHALAPLAIAAVAAISVGGLMVANDVACWYFIDCGTGTATMALQKDCYFCVIFVTLACQGGGYSRAIFAMFVPMALSVGRFCFLMFIVMQVGKIFVFPKEGGENLKEIVKQASFYTLAISALTASAAGGNNPWLFEWVFDLMQRLTLAVSMKAINYMAMQGIGQIVTASIPNFGGGCAGLLPSASSGSVSTLLPYATEVAQQYANLWAHVELGIWPIVKIAMQRITPDHFTASGAISGILLAAPYVFVMGVFGAFMVQTMFYFIAITAAAPFLVSGIMFQTSRGWLLSAFRFLVGGCMTIFFSAIAMGFTLSLIVINLSIQIQTVGASSVNDVQGLNKNAFGQAADAIKSSGVWQMMFGSGTPDAAATTATNVVTLTLASADNAAYWQLFLIGYISIMLHLAAPRIASNISGANDSATTAATVVGVGQMAAGKVLSGSRIGVGSAVGATGQLAGGAFGWAAQRAGDLLKAFRGSGAP